VAGYFDPLPKPDYDFDRLLRWLRTVEIAPRAIFATSGTIENLSITGTLTMTTAGEIKSAASGLRVEIGGSAGNIQLFSGDASEVDEGRLGAVAGDGTAAEQIDLRLRGPARTGGGSPVTAFINIRSEAADASIPLQIVFDTSNTLSITPPEFKLSDGFVAMLEDGSAARPALEFNNDTNTGIWRPGADRLALVTGGTQRFEINGSTAVESTLPFRGAVGSTSTPTYSWTTDTDTGIYHSATDEVGVSAGAVLAASFAASLITLKQPLAYDQMSSGLDTATATYTNTSYLDLDGLTGGTPLGAGVITTVTTGTRALVIISGELWDDTANAEVFLSFRVSGATTVASADSSSLYHRGAGAANDRMGASSVHVVTLTAGVNTFELQARATAGTASLRRSRLQVVPL